MNTTKLGRRYRALILLAVFGGIGMFAAAYTLVVRHGDVIRLTEFGNPQHFELAVMKLDHSWMISGSPTFRANAFAASKDGASASGIWECSGPATFIWRYGVDETIYILEGATKIEYLGKTVTLGPGDSLRFAAGTHAVWTVPNYVKKTYRLDNPGRIVRVLRRLFASDA